MLINTKPKGGRGRGDIFCGGGTKSASRMCPPGQNQLADSVRGTESASGFYPGEHNLLADSVRGDNNWGGTKSAMTPGIKLRHEH